MEKQVNNNIRGNYMDRLGVNNPRTDSRGPTENYTVGSTQTSANHLTNRISQMSADTYQFDPNRSQNLVISKD